jgi:dolichyl-phosphate-mannose-protein mannosyltransferase
MKKTDYFLLGGVVLAALLFRLYDFSYPPHLWGDEVAHVPAATNYWLNGQFLPDNWEHPPFRHLIEYVFLQLFGDNPAGWRMRNILFGSVAAALTFIFAHQTTQSRTTALLAGLFLATDPLHIVLSRYTFDEVYGGVFFLTALVLYLKSQQRSSIFILSAFFMGCALATKWYFVPCWLFVCLLALYDSYTTGQRGAVAFILTTYLLIPISIYIFSFYNWFGRGYTFTELFEFIVNAYSSLQNYRAHNYNSGLLFLGHTSPSEWFIRPIILGKGTYHDQNSGEFIVYANSLPIWGLTVPAMIGLGIISLKQRCLRLAMPVLFFCVTYGLYLFVRRPAFLYSSSILLPFAFTAIAYGLAHLAERYGAKLFFAIAAALLAWNLYLYPFVTAKKIPVELYRYLITSSGIHLH